jgi:serine/threonine protein kinase/Flp pilus assembly protein TadD
MNETDLPNAADTESLLAELADEFMDRLRRGDKPDADDYARRYPRIAAVLRNVLRALEVMDSSEADGSVAATDPPGEVRPEAPLGDYRLIREIGRGGMGIVYQAVQVSLGREVALKVLPFASAMDSRQLQRFKNEAQAAAHLHHANIVPVHGVGCERGVHYYAMQYIEGQTLAAIIAELRQIAGMQSEQRDGTAVLPTELTRELASGRWAPAIAGKLERARPAIAADRDRTPVAPPDVSSTGVNRSSSVASMVDSTRRPAYFRTVASLGVQAARALEHAHALGVIHRDIKPANMIVDQRCNLWITDFGLARLQDGADLTMTGDLVGTLRYMSPEQAMAGRSVLDHRTDVYSLGMTLYELVTLQTAFGTMDRRELLRQIGFDEPPRPKILNKALPSDLETIVLKAIEKNPAQRYATAAELADDLERFLEDRPIRARRPTLMELARKFAWRHRPVVATGAAGLVVALTILAVGLGWIVRDRAARSEFTDREAIRALAEASAFQARARWPEALEAAKRAEGFLAVAGSADLRRRAQELRNDVEMVLRLERIRLPQSVNGFEGAYDHRRADTSYGEAFRDYGIDVEALQPAEAARRIRPRAIHRELIVALDQWAARRGHLDPRGFDSAGWKRLVAVARAADSDEMRNRIRDSLERGDKEALGKLATSAEASELPVQTVSLLGEYLDPKAGGFLLRRVQREHPDEFWINFQLGWNLNTDQNFDGAIRFYTAALAVRPRNAPTHYFLAEVLRRAGMKDEAIAEHHKAIELDPDESVPRAGLVVGQLLAHHQFDEAIFWCRHFLEWRPHDGRAHSLLANALYCCGKFDEAFAESEIATAHEPDRADSWNSLAWILATCPDTSRRDVQRAVGIATNLVASVPKCGKYWNTMGVALYRAGDWRGAIGALDRSVALQGFNSWDGLFLAMARWQSGERAEARRLFDEALRWVDRNDPQDDELRRFRAEAAKLLLIDNPR